MLRDKEHTRLTATVVLEACPTIRLKMVLIRANVYAASVILGDRHRTEATALQVLALMML